MWRKAYFPDSNINLLAALVARYVEETVAFGRQLGILYPKEYDVGFKLKEHPIHDGRCEITIRVGTTKVTSQARWNARGGETAAAQFMETLSVLASNAVLTWSSDNPSFAPDEETAAKLLKHFDDPAWQKAASDRAFAVSRDAKFVYPWGKLENY